MVGTNSYIERRQHQRKTVGFEVLLSDGNGETLIMQAVNKSETGLYLLSEGEKRPSLGAKVKIRLNGYAVNGIKAPLYMLVTRIDNYGLGLRYLRESTL